MPAPPLVVFRCDGGPAIGGGHVMRCLALAEELAAAGTSCRFAVTQTAAAMLPGPSKAGFDILTLPELDVDAEIAHLRGKVPEGAALLVVDHYRRGADFTRPLRGWARRILAIDDRMAPALDCDLLLDSSCVDPGAYAGRLAPGTRTLFGPTYALVRRSFRHARAAALARRNSGPIRELLIAFGAADPWNASGRALDALVGRLPEIRRTVVLSSKAAHADALKARAAADPALRLLFDMEDMPSLLRDADLAIGAAGGSAFERACLGLPTVLVTAVDNQRGIGALFTSAGAAVDAGCLDAELETRLADIIEELVGDSARRSALAQAAARLVDGEGARRVAEAAL